MHGENGECGIDQIIEEVARINQVTPEEVRREMESCIRMAYERPHKTTLMKSTQQSISPGGGTPSVEDFIAKAATTEGASPEPLAAYIGCSMRGNGSKLSEPS